MKDLKKKELSILIAKYTLLFCVFAFFCVIIFFLFIGKSMFDHSDGTYQQFTYFVTCGRYTREFFYNLFINHEFVIPMWDRTIGMGSDLNIIFNPFAAPLLCLISALTPAKYSEYVFDLIVLIRLYLSGLSFLFFATGKNHKGYSAIAGALVYVFSATTFIVFSQMKFSSTYILFPLLLLGADKVWKNNNHILYVIVLSYSMIMSFYFTYMMLILLVIYCFIRFFCEENRTIKKFFSLFGRFVVLTIIPLIIGIGMMLPGIINLTKLSRLQAHYEMSIINLDVIKRFFAYGFNCIQADGDSMIGVSSFAFISVVCLIASKKKEPVIKWCLSLCLLSFAFPLIGSVFNGFNYPSYRYIFSLILCVAYVVTISFDSVKLFKGKIWIISLGISILYGAICFLFIDSYSFVSALSLIITVFLVGIINSFESHLIAFREKLYIAVIFVSCVLIGYSCIYFYIGQLMIDRGTIYETVFDNDGINLRESVDDPKYRTEIINADYVDNIMNSSMAVGISGFDFYHSYQNQFVGNYYTSLAVLGNPMEFSHTGFRSRCYAMILNACNYIVRSDQNNTCIRAPYSYDFVKKEGDYSLYKSSRGVSLVYFYDSVISNESYMALDPVNRETNLMYSMVIDEPKNTGSVLVSDVISVPFEITDYNNILVDGDKLIVLEDGGEITLKLNNIESGQISVYLSSLKSSTVDNWYYRNAIALLDSDNKPIAIDYSSQFITTYHYYFGSDDIVFSFESIDEKITAVKIFILYPGEYDIGDIHIYSRPYENMEQTLDAFYEHADMENISYEYKGNHLNISATSDSDKYLYIAIPYSEGWKAKVDGETTEIIRANIAFMAIPLSSGTHSIEMTYTTPYLYTGWIISAFGIIMYIGYMVWDRKQVLKRIHNFIN